MLKKSRVKDFDKAKMSDLLFVFPMHFIFTLSLFYYNIVILFSGGRQNGLSTTF